MKIKTISGGINEKPPGTTWLQGIGHVAGKPASEFKQGDTMVWNGGSTSKVESIIAESSSFITFEVSYEWMGQQKTAQRRLKKERIVACTTDCLV